MASKKSGTKAKSVGGARRGKSKVKRELKDLDIRKGKEVRGAATNLQRFDPYKNFKF